jgi:hypothetical protein
MPRQVWSSPLVLETIRELQTQGEPLAYSQIAAARPRLVYAAVRYFGSWGAALAAAGVDTDTVQSEGKASRADKMVKWSEETILEQIKEIASGGERMTGSGMRLKYPSLYYAAVSDRYFGSWKRALEQAGVRPVITRTRPGEQDAWRTQLLLDRVRELKGQYGAMSAELARAVCPEILQAVEERFGDWDQGLKMADSEGNAMSDN